MSSILIKNDSFANVLDLPLFEAVEKKRSLKLLFDQKANPNCLNDQGLPLIHFAYASRNFQALKEISDHPGSDRNISFKGRSVLYQACLDGNEEVVKILANTVKDICTLGEENLSPLTLAASQGKVNILEILCQRGESNSSMDKKEGDIFFEQRDVALNQACSKSQTCAIDLLFRLGASLQYCNSSGFSSRAFILAKTIRHDLIDTIPVDPYTEEFVKRKVLALFSKNVGLTNIDGRSFVLGGYHAPLISQIISNHFELFSTDSNSGNAKKISAAFSFRERPEDIDKIVRNIQMGNLVVISVGWEKHVISIIFYKNYLAITNRGPMPSGFNPITMFRIDFEKVNASLIKEIFGKHGMKQEESMDFFYFKLPQILSPRRDYAVVRDRLCWVIEAFSPKKDYTGICSLASQKTALRCCLMLLATEKVPRFVSYEQVCKKAVSLYKEWSTFARIKQLQSYLSSHFGCSALHPIKGPHKEDPDLNLIKVAYGKVLKHMGKAPAPQAFRELNDKYGSTLRFISESSFLN